LRNPARAAAKLSQPPGSTEELGNLIVKQKKFSFGGWFSKALSGSDDQRPILDEKTFNRMLCLERKRSHRTGNSFVLLVVNIAELRQDSQDKIPAFWDALQYEIRDTDLCGWYQEPTAIGAIFTALQDLNHTAIGTAISAKVNRALSKVMNPVEFSRVHMSFHFYPETSEHEGAPVLKSDEKLYPDLIDTEKSKSIYHGLKRVIDVVGSLGFLAVASPLFAIIAIAIRLSSQGPVFFKQIRVGRFGKEFQCLKFRTMYADCNHEIHRRYVQNLIKKPDDSQKVYKIVNDPRVTSIGGLLRKTSLDELPQFINVLLGDMSLVGPRPPIPYEISCYRPWHRRRLIETKPGITGLWQVYGRSRTSFDEMVRLDIRYIEKQSIWLDIKIIMLTPWAVITCMGAY